MIRPEELRIGNYYQHSQAGIIQLDKEWISYFAKYPELLSGVPLTEDWLIKFGFATKIIEGQEFKNFIGNDEGGYTVRFFDDTAVMQVVAPSLWQMAFCWNLKYVHQLQNLYFALTGEDLTIKEEQK